MCQRDNSSRANDMTLASVWNTSTVYSTNINFVHVLYTFLYSRTLSSTSSSCGIVAGAAALVLEKFPHYTPQQVKEYLIDQSTPGVVQTSSTRYRVKPNRLLYVGKEG